MSTMHGLAGLLDAIHERLVVILSYLAHWPVSDQVVRLFLSDVRFPFPSWVWYSGSSPSKGIMIDGCHHQQE
ncbi:hypothetical protein RHGRI_015964 [Rhododendron griersonianum]|uniref:Uncharacterized protein n=1 Tax=Rhododendron griersonianum TaxID=479676 RepID=A0AAV6JP77_9ERIC|nr:hypothetical protein RHGRI_015964 [Rhododendron griersonianum]